MTVCLTEVAIQDVKQRHVSPRLAQEEETEEEHWGTR